MIRNCQQIKGNTRIVGGPWFQDTPKRRAEMVRANRKLNKQFEGFISYWMEDSEDKEVIKKTIGEEL